MRGYGELTRTVLGQYEIRAHAALALHATAERHGLQVPAQVIGPLVVRANKHLQIARQFTAELGGAMGAAVLEHRDAAVFGSGNDNRRRTNVAADEVAWIGDLSLQANTIPGATVENALDLAPVDPRVGVDPVRDAGKIVFWPDILSRQIVRYVHASPCIR